MRSPGYPMMDGMVPTVVVLNRGSSSGKSSLTRELQPLLPGTWLRFSVDTLIDACPPQLLSQGGLDIAANGSIDVGEAFTRIEQCWMAGLAAMARTGAHLLIEDGFLSGPAAQARWAEALHGLTSCGSESGSHPTLPPSGRLVAGIERWAWQQLRRTACTGASTTTWR